MPKCPARQHSVSTISMLGTGTIDLRGRCATRRFRRWRAISRPQRSISPSAGATEGISSVIDGWAAVSVTRTTRSRCRGFPSASADLSSHALAWFSLRNIIAWAQLRAGSDEFGGPCPWTDRCRLDLLTRRVSRGLVGNPCLGTCLADTSAQAGAPVSLDGEPAGATSIFAPRHSELRTGCGALDRPLAALPQPCGK
jgi:hypothetical protein